MEKIIGKNCIVRGNRSGVFFGKVVSVDKECVEMENARCIYYWHGALSVLEIAKNGININNSKLTVTVNNIVLLDVIEIVPCTEKTIIQLNGIEEWKK